MALSKRRGSKGKLAKICPMRQSGLTFLVALLVMLGGCTSPPDGVEPVTPFDVGRYQGVWYEIMRLDHSFERGLTNVTATYALRDDGSVGVLNRGFERERCRWKEAEGQAQFQGSTDIASLSVTFFWPFAGGYHVFDLDQAEYAWALVSGPSRSYLWILARKPDLPPDITKRLIQKAGALGFPVDELILVDHGPTTCLPAESP